MKINDIFTYPLLERNVANIADVDSYVSNFQNELQNPNAKQWVKSNFRKWLIDKYKNITPVTQVNQNSPSWLQAAIERGDNVVDVNFGGLDEITTKIRDFLNSEYDTKNKDLSRISIDQMQILHDKWVEQINKAQDKKVEITNVNKEIKEIYRFKDGFRIIQLITPDMKEREGKLMGHCVGTKCYTKKTIFSLFDINNQPHATLEVEGNEVTQLQGKGNTGVVEKYWPYLREFFSKTGYELNTGYMKKIGLIEIEGNIYDINELPDNLQVRGGLNLTNTKITQLPDNLQVRGGLNLTNTKITQLPDNLKVGDYLDLSNTKITQLPDNLQIGGWLDLSNTNITQLPDNLKISDWLDISNTKITQLPDNLQIGSGLNLSNTNITQLPDNLQVGGNLNLSNTKITQLPDNLKVVGWLDLTNTKITQLPDNLKVVGWLDLTNTKITQLPDNLQIGGYLDISNTKITQLPDNLQIGDWLDLGDTRLAKKPTSYFSKKNLAKRGIKIGGKIRFS